MIDAFEPDGQPDSSFADGGVLQGLLDSAAFDVAVAPDGDIRVAAFINGQHEVLAFNAEGSPDMGFGIDGAAVIHDAESVGCGGGAGLYVRSDGEILVTGETIPSKSCCGRGFVEQLEATGSVDTTFGRGGRVVLGAPGLELDPSRT